MILDNDFRYPEIDRYLDRFELCDPSIGILGDANNRREVEELNTIATELKERYLFKELVVLPKCREAFDILDEVLVLGYPMGYCDIYAEEFSELSDWRGRHIHLLGASSPKQNDLIVELTHPTLTGDPPTDIVGLDWNSNQGVAYKGEYWIHDGCQPADHLPIGETVRKSLDVIKEFWEENSVWPDTEPIGLYGEAVTEPDELIFMDHGGDPIPGRKILENAYVDEYSYNGDQVTWAFQDESAKLFVEYREGLH